MTIYKEIVTLPKDSIYEQVEGLNGKQCYDRFGLKEDEALKKTITFPNNYSVDIMMCICDEEYLTYSQAVLYNKEGSEVTFTEPADSMIGEWWLEDTDGNTYNIDVIVE